MTTILAFGDSNTHGTPPMADENATTRFARNTRWPGALQGLLGPGTHVIEEGLGGRTTCLDDPTVPTLRNGATALPMLLKSHAPLDLLIVMLGTNDLQHRFSMTAQEIAWGLRRLAETNLMLGAASAMLFIVPPPVVETGVFATAFTGAEARQRDLADHMRRALAPSGASVIDAGDAIAVDPLDGIHFDAAAHNALARHLVGPVRDLIKGETT